MPAAPLAVEWANINAVRSYPLSVSATKIDETGTMTLPDDVLLALYLPVHAGVTVEASHLFLRELVVDGNGVNFSIGYDDGSDDPPVIATAAVPFSGHREGAVYPLAGKGDFSDSRGQVVVGTPGALRSLPAGRFTFSYAAGQLDPDTVKVVIRAVTGISVVSGADVSAPITGLVEFVAGANLALSVSSIPGQPTRIRFDAVTGEGLTQDCECTSEDSVAPPIRLINGIPPTPDGLFTIQGDECINVAEATNGLRLSDNCSKACCGAAELDAVLAEVKRFGEAQTTLTNFANRLEGVVNRMEMTVLGSRLNDEGCVDCDPEA